MITYLHQDINSSINFFIGLQSTLLPVKKSIPAQNLNGVSNDQANVVKQTSVLKSSNQSSTNGSAHQKGMQNLKFSNENFNIEMIYLSYFQFKLDNQY